MEGGKDIKFVIGKEDVMKRVYMNSYYRGERLKAEGGARMQAYTDDDAILTDELMTGAAEVKAMITRFLGRCRTTEPKVVVKVGTELWELVETGEHSNYTRTSDGKNIYLEGEIKVGAVVNARETEAGRNNEATVMALPEIAFEIKGASGFPDECREIAEDEILCYLTDRVLQGWMAINMPSESIALEAAAERVVNILRERRKPI
jgi:hypothetical protein